MQNFFIFVILPLLVVATYVAISTRVDRFLAYRYDKLNSETNLLKAQAAHVLQTAEVEKSTLEATIKAYEKQGANKLRTQIAALGGDLAKVEAMLGSKLKAVPLGEVKPATEGGCVCVGSAPGGSVIGTINGSSSAKTDSTPTVYNGQPSPGAKILA